MTAKLTPKRELFCQLYTTHWNATRAAREAGYSEESASERGYELRQDPSVKARIEELRSHALEELGVSPERVLKELSRIAFTNMKDLATWTHSGVEFRPSSDISDDIGATIVEVSETVTQQGGTLRIKQHDKVKALELLGKHQKLFADRVEHSGPNGKPIEHKNLSELPDDQLEAKIARLMGKPDAEGSA